MKILCNVDQAACFRHGIDAPTSTVKLDIDPQTLTPEQRNFVADQMYEGVRFSKDPAFYIVPPTIEGFFAAVNYGIEVQKQGGLLGPGQVGLGIGHLGFGGVALEMIRFSAVEGFTTQAVRSLDQPVSQNPLPGNGWLQPEPFRPGEIKE
jgi:hypothetical protein